MFKNIKYFLLLNLLPPLIFIFIQFLKKTSRIEHVNIDPVRELWNRNENCICCFWHGRLLMMPFLNNIRKRGKVLISRHRDGELIARVISFFGLGTIRGSYRKKSISSVREILADLKKGYDVAITPDGPKGPRYQVKPGIIELSRLSGKPIVPVTYSASKKKLLNPGTNSFSPIPLTISFSSGASPFI